MPARVRCLTPSMVSAPLRMASRISASVTFSHRQTMCPYLELDDTMSFFLSRDAGSKRSHPVLFFLKSFFSSTCMPRSMSTLMTRSAIPGAAVSPGAPTRTWITPGVRVEGPTKKSPSAALLLLCRMPENPVITSFSDRAGTSSCPSLTVSRMFSRLTSVSLLCFGFT